jgi:hypothetical protein
MVEDISKINILSSENSQSLLKQVGNGYVALLEDSSMNTAKVCS